MVGIRSDRARARALHLLATIYPIPDDAEFYRLRELAVDFIKEADRLDAANRDASAEPGRSGRRGEGLFRARPCPIRGTKKALANFQMALAACERPRFHGTQPQSRDRSYARTSWH